MAAPSGFHGPAPRGAHTRRLRPEFLVDDGTPPASSPCGNVWEFVAGLRLMDGVLQVIPDKRRA
jgi:hypothetical protein